MIRKPQLPKPPEVVDRDTKQWMNRMYTELDTWMTKATDTLNRATQSREVTGGTGSAGTGNQHVEIKVLNTTYKILHDGTI